MDTNSISLPKVDTARYIRGLAEDVMNGETDTMIVGELKRAIHAVEVEAFNGNVNLAFLHAARKALEVL